MDVCEHPEILKVLSANVKDDNEPDVFDSSDEKRTGDEKGSKNMADDESPIGVASSKVERSDSNVSDSGFSSVVKDKESSGIEADTKRLSHCRKRGRGLFFSDISSSESESEHIEMTTRKGGKRSKLSFPDSKQQLEKLSEDEEAVSAVKEESSSDKPKESELEPESSQTLSGILFMWNSLVIFFD